MPCWLCWAPSEVRIVCSGRPLQQLAGGREARGQHRQLRLPSLRTRGLHRLHGNPRATTGHRPRRYDCDASSIRTARKRFPQKSVAADKNFFLSEFGGPSCGGKLAADCHEGPSDAPHGCKDSCAWFDTPQEESLGLVLAEKVLATLNSGGQSTGYWTFQDPLGTQSRPALAAPPAPGSGSDTVGVARTR